MESEKESWVFELLDVKWKKSYQQKPFLIHRILHGTAFHPEHEAR